MTFNDSTSVRARFRRVGIRTALLGLTAAACGVFWAPSSQAVGTRHFVIESGADFAKGELEGAAVDSSGKLRAGLDLGAIEVLDADTVWASLQRDGGIYLGTGNEAKLLHVKEGAVSVVAQADAMAITAIEEAFGKVLVGTMPGGKILELKGDKLEPFADLGGAGHVWALSYDSAGKVLYAATGPEGQLFRITADGTAQVYFKAQQNHLVSVLAQGGKVYVGTSGAARLIEVSGPGRAQVLFDFEKTEVRAMRKGKDGSLYAIVNELSDGPRSDSIKSTEPSGPHSSSPSGGKGKLVRFHPDGHPEVLFEDSDSHFVSLTLDPNGRPVVGMGADGRVVRVNENHRSTVIADVEERQAADVIFSKTGGWVVGSDPIVAHPITGVGGTDAVYTSEVLDAGIRAKFGRIDWEGKGKFEVSARSGNTKEADETWTDWTAPLNKGAAVPSAAGRYLQIRVRLLDAQAELSRLDVPFVTDNLRPVVTEVKAKSRAGADGSRGVDESGAPIGGKPSSKIKLDWEVENPDKDELRYFVEYRLESGQEWFDALEPGQVLTSDSLEWDTDNLPEGRYRVRVTASDELANPPGRARKHQLSSDSILVDNTAPQFQGVRIAGDKLVGVVSDGIGPIRRLELRLPQSNYWIPFEPTDGIFDEEKETFSFDLSPLSLPDTALLTVRVFDMAGNSEVSHVKWNAPR